MATGILTNRAHTGLLHTHTRTRVTCRSTQLCQVPCSNELSARTMMPEDVMSQEQHLLSRPASHTDAACTKQITWQVGLSGGRGQRPTWGWLTDGAEHRRTAWTGDTFSRHQATTGQSINQWPFTNPTLQLLVTLSQRRHEDCLNRHWPRDTIISIISHP